MGEGCSLILEMGPEEWSVQVHWCVATTIVHLISLLAPFPAWAAAILTPEWLVISTGDVDYSHQDVVHPVNRVSQHKQALSVKY